MLLTGETLARIKKCGLLNILPDKFVNLESGNVMTAKAERSEMHRRFLFSEPRDVVAYNLPTFADCYAYTKVDLPSIYRLRCEADKIIAALEDAGFKIEPR